MTLSTSRTQVCPKCAYENPKTVQCCQRCHTSLGPTFIQPETQNGTSGPVGLSSRSPLCASSMSDGDATLVSVDRRPPVSALLVHTTTSQRLILDPHGFVWRLGKPHQGIRPDLDVSTVSHAEIVSRAHALIRYDCSQYSIEDTNSSNGTFVNSDLLVPGRRYPLNDGDRIALGKGDLVSFFFHVCAV